MQLINTAVYDQVSQQRSRAIAETMEQQQKRRDMVEKARLQKHLQHMQVQSAQANKSAAASELAPVPHEIEVEGLRFRITDGGSKLVRVLGEVQPLCALGYSSLMSPDGPNASIPTPKKTSLAGVTFFRSKNGNLYRAGLVKTKK
jgi:hypothetical protein